MFPVVDGDSLCLDAGGSPLSAFAGNLLSAIFVSGFSFTIASGGSLLCFISGNSLLSAVSDRFLEEKSQKCLIIMIYID